MLDLLAFVDEGGRPLSAPPLIRQISKDPVLQNVKLIAEPWDLGMYQVKTPICIILNKMIVSRLETFQIGIDGPSGTGFSETMFVDLLKVMEVRKKQHFLNY